MDKRNTVMRAAAFVVVVVGCVLGRPAPARAIPLFAHQYEVTCAKCHSVIPHLTPFGAAFMANGDRIPGVQPGPAFPISTKANLVDSSEYQGDGENGAGLPKAIVDEIEVFTAGAIGTRSSFFVEQYVVDGGQHGLTRDAWVSDRVNPWDAKIPVFIQGGSYTLPLPVDPETFRDTYADYSIFVQTVGANPFNFFDPKIGAHLTVGDTLRGVSGQFFAGPGHDRQSGLPTDGTDTMAVVADAAGPLGLTAYRYTGSRPTPAGQDRFWRQGYGLVYDQWGRFSSEAVLQTGWDSTCGILASLGCASSGGFEQLRWQFNRRLFAEGRYEGTNDPTNGFTRDGILLLGYGPSERSRITIEDVIAHSPLATHTLNLQFTIAY
jgi:hypothetical protein